MNEVVQDHQRWEENCTPQVAHTIMERLMEKGSVEALCRDKDMPSERVFRRLLVVNQYFRDLYREAGAALRLLWAMEVVTISDGGLDPDQKLGYEGGDSRNRLTRDQLRVSARIQLINSLDLKTRTSRLTAGTDSKVRVAVEGEVVDSPAEDPQQIRHRLAEWLGEQKERMGSDSITALMMDLTASPAGMAAELAAVEDDDE